MSNSSYDNVEENKRNIDMNFFEFPPFEFQDDLENIINNNSSEVIQVAAVAAGEPVSNQILNA